MTSTKPNATDRRKSIVSANDHSAPEQGAGVRPSLSAHVAAVCADLRNRARLGRPLPVKAVQR